MIDWGVGAYEHTAAMLEPVSRIVVDAIRVASGERALDLACGTGNAALALAQHGAQVVAVDPAVRLLDVLRHRAAQAGADVDVRQGDAESIPADTSSFDCAVSVFGIIFAPDPEKATRELVRVVKPGGRLVITSWVQQGAVSEAGGILWQAASVATGGATRPPSPWGEPESVREMFARCGADAQCAIHDVFFEAESAEAWFAEQERHHPVWITVKHLLAKHPEVWDDARAKTVDVMKGANEASDRLLVRSSYILTQATRRA